MSDQRRERMRARVQQMFQMVKPPSEGRTLDDKGVPSQLRGMSDEIFSDDITFHVPGRGPQAFSGGKEAYYAFHAERMRKTESRMKLELKDILLGDDYACALIRYSDEADGERFEWLRVNVYRFDADADKIVEIRVFEHDQYGVDDFFARSFRSAS